MRNDCGMHMQTSVYQYRQSFYRHVAEVEWGVKRIELESRRSLIYA
jgi:hypothetical protein